jgi:hypothetical protein
MNTPTQPPPDEWKPTAPALRDPPENVYSVLAKACETLRVASRDEQILGMQRRVFAAESYDEALAIMGEYVNWGES